jgi:hypothetical protein
MSETDRNRRLLVVFALVALFCFSRADGEEPDAAPKKLLVNIGGVPRPTYMVELHEKSLLYSAGGARPVKITPTKKQWRAFRRAIDDLGIWSWRPQDCRPAADGVSALILLEYADRSIDLGVHCHDDLYGPHTVLKSFLALVQELIGGRHIPLANQ